MRNLFRQSFSVSFCCRASKANKHGYSPIEMVININGERVYVQLPRKETSENFSKLYGSKRGNELKTYLNKLYSDINAKASEMQVMGLPLTANGLKDFWKNGVKVYSVRDAFDEYLALLSKRTGFDLSLSAFRKYEIIGKYFISIVGNKNISDVTNADILKFESDVKINYKRSTANGYMSKAKSFFIYALKNNIIKSNPFDGIKISKACEEVRIITEDEYSRIRDKFFSIERLGNIRDLFIFGCCSGLSFCDILELKKEDFTLVDGRYVINKKRKKTNVEFYSIILDDGIEIAKKYDFDFSSIVLSNQKTNAYLKEIADLCGVSSIDSLHWHISRHLYITRLIRSGIPHNIVAKCAGHSNTNMTKRYTHLVSSDIVSIVSKHI